MLDWLNNARNVALTVTAFIAAGSGLVGINTYFDSKYAQAAEVEKKIEKVETRLTIAELKQLYRTAQEEVFFYRDQMRKYPGDLELKLKLKEAEETAADLKKQIQELEKK
jgi:hypothetical protein